MANRSNQRGRARDSDSNARGAFRNLHAGLTDSRASLGVTPMEKSRLGPKMTRNLKQGFRDGNIEATNKYGEDHQGDMPQLGERTKQSHRTTSIKHRHLS